MMNMKEVSFQISEDEYEIIESIAGILNKSVSSLLKEISLQKIGNIAPEIALKLYSEKKIGLKKAWKISRMSFFEFSDLIVKNNIEPPISDELDDKLIDNMLSTDLKDIFPRKKADELRKRLLSC